MLAQQSQGLVNLIQQNSKLIIWAIVLVGFAVIRVVKFLNEQAEKNRARGREQKMEAEALRTGRPLPVPQAHRNDREPGDEPAERPASPSQRPVQPVAQMPSSAPLSAGERLEQLAAQRRAQVEALRRQAAGGAPPVTSAPQQARPRPVQTAAAQSSNSARAEGARSGGARRENKASQGQNRKTTQPPPVQRREDLDTGESSTQRTVADVPSTQLGMPSLKQLPPIGESALQPRSARSLASTSATWRRAMVLREALDAPLSLRNDASVPDGR